MPILELTDAQVVELLKQLPPERQRAALLSLAASGAPLREQRMRYAEGQLQRLSAGAAETGTKCRRTSAKLSSTIFCTRIVSAEDSRLRHQYLVFSSRLEGQAVPVHGIGAHGKVNGVTCREVLDELA